MDKIMQRIGVVLAWLALGGALAWTLSACSLTGTQSVPAQPGPHDFREVTAGLWEACTPVGDRVYVWPGSGGGVGMAAIENGCAR